MLDLGTQNDAETMKRIMKNFGALVREKRIKKNMTQETLSELVDITDVYLRDIEKGAYKPTWIIWLRICTCLGIEIEDVQTLIERTRTIENYCLY